LLEEQSCQISPQSDLKRRSLRLFEERRPNNNNNNNNKMSSDAGPFLIQKLLSAERL